MTDTFKTRALTRATFFKSRRFIYLAIGWITVLMGWFPIMTTENLMGLKKGVLLGSMFLDMLLLLVYMLRPRFEKHYAQIKGVILTIVPLLLLCIDTYGSKKPLDPTDHVMFAPLFFTGALFFLGLKWGMLAAMTIFLGTVGITLNYYLPQLGQLSVLEQLHFGLVGKFYAASLISIGFLAAIMVFVEGQVSSRVTAELTAELALKDLLTGLDSRQLFHERLEQALHVAQRNRESFLLLFIDLDHFKEVNDRLGHHTGDLLLKLFAGRLQQGMRKSDTVARLSGDEFAIIAHRATLQEAELLGEKLQQVLRVPMILEGQPYIPSASIGISVYPDHGQTSSELLMNADQAMYHSKTRGRNAFTVFEQLVEQGASSISRTVLQKELQLAIDADQVVLHYQPIYDSQTQKLVGMEALARWTHPTLGAIAPEVFIPLSEETGMIQQLGQKLLQQACCQNHRWQHHGLVVSVNVSAVQFNRSDFVQVVQQALEHSGLAAELLEVELTESAVLQENAAANLQTLQTMGVRVSLDDFGTGYSSLSRLQDLPISGFKIDRKFIQDITGRDPLKGSRKLIKLIVMLADVLNLKVVAEGVETAQQLETVLSSGCERVQGFLLSIPLPPAEFEKLMETPSQTSRMPEG